MSHLLLIFCPLGSDHLIFMGLFKNKSNFNIDFAIKSFKYHFATYENVDNYVLVNLILTISFRCIAFLDIFSRLTVLWLFFS